MKVIIDAMHSVGGRLCHDLAAPIGAMSLGLEMLSEKDLTKDQQDTVSLIEQSLGEAKRRLELFRLLLGYDQAVGRPMIPEIITFLDRYWHDSKLTLSTEGIADLQGSRARLVLALILTASDALPRGGEINVKLVAQTLSIMPTGIGAKISSDTTNALIRDMGTTLPSHNLGQTLWACYARAIAKELHLHIETSQVPLGIIVTTDQDGLEDALENAKEVGWGARIRT